MVEVSAPRDTRIIRKPQARAQFNAAVHEEFAYLLSVGVLVDHIFISVIDNDETHILVDGRVIARVRIRSGSQYFS